MQGRPLVSIAVPVYNAESSIRNALDSIKAQTYANLEILICDNASTDRTSEICLDYAARDPRFRYHRNTANIGQTRNFRLALEMASGELFMWTCADDMRPRTAVEHLVSALLRNDRAVMAHGPVIAKGKNFEMEVANEMDLSSALPAQRVRAFTLGLRHNSMIHGLYRRSALKGLTLGAHYGQDYLFTLQVCLKGPVEYIRHPMIIYWEKGTMPILDPIGAQETLPLRGLIRGHGTKGKCLKVLITGCKYLLKGRDVPLLERMEAAAAHLTTFGRLYRRGLVMDSISLFLRPWTGRPKWTGT
jgi:hypothetical protein